MLTTITIEEDDVVLDLPASLLQSASSHGTEELRSFHRQSTSTVPAKDDDLPESSVTQHPAARGVGEDIIHMVTDAFREKREEEIARRRRLLYDITHPNPLHYRYAGKLVPPPPLSFGEITSESIQLGDQLLVQPTYSLVNRAGTRSTDAIDEDGTRGMIEVGEKAAGLSTKTRTKYRSRKREDNIFRDHNYFFEINELYQEIVLVGKACAGKSSLLNALLGQPGLAKTSSTPNTTRAINFYQSVSPEELQKFHEKERHNLVKLPGKGLQLTFVDVPGFGIEGMSDQWRDAAIELTDAYFGVRRSVNTVLFCIDCDKGLTPTDMRYFRWLENVQGVFYIVLTKCDSVPHTRLCSVMRQIYSLITRNRRKYRKVFPFIIPTSAKTGENIDMLRGLIMETSGMIPGDTLRELLQQKQQVTNQEALRKEAMRLEAIRRREREESKQLFLSQHSPLLEDGKGSGGGTLPPATDRPSSSLTQPVSYRLPIHSSADGQTAFADFYRQYRRANPSEDAALARVKAHRLWRKENPLQRESSPYGEFEFKLNTGLERPQDEEVVLDYGVPAAEEGDTETAAVAPPPEAVTSRVIGLEGSAPASGTVVPSDTSTGGTVSRFLHTLEQFGEQRKKGKHSSSSRRKRRTSFMAEGSDGRLHAFEGGVAKGPALPHVHTDVEKRKAEWRMTQLGEMLAKENPSAPWTAVEQIKRKVDARKEMNIMRNNMSRKDVQAYLSNAGKITEAFEKFENEVTTNKFMTENRTTKTLRSQQQMHLNSTAKINYRSMPVGLWKHYGERDTYWPTPRVLGSKNDERHPPK